MSKRDWRRHHLRRMKDRARKVAQNNWWFSGEDDLRRAEKLANHLKSCSCSACCNLRNKRSWDSDITQQEKKAEMSFRDQLDELM